MRTTLRNSHIWYASLAKPVRHAKRDRLTLCGYLEVRFTYNLLRNCSSNPIISRVTVVMGFTIGL